MRLPAAITLAVFAAALVLTAHTLTAAGALTGVTYNVMDYGAAVPSYIALTNAIVLKVEQ